MKRKIDSEQSKRMNTRRFATVEPVFGNTRSNQRLDRFTLTRQKKVDGQWKRYCLMQIWRIRAMRDERNKGRKTRQAELTSGQITK